MPPSRMYTLFLMRSSSISLTYLISFANYLNKRLSSDQRNQWVQSDSRKAKAWSKAHPSRAAPQHPRNSLSDPVIAQQAAMVVLDAAPFHMGNDSFRPYTKERKQSK